jgi:hypothetical protein
MPIWVLIIKKKPAAPTVFLFKKSTHSVSQTLSEHLMQHITEAAAI